MRAPETRPCTHNALHLVLTPCIPLDLSSSTLPARLVPAHCSRTASRLTRSPAGPSSTSACTCCAAQEPKPCRWGVASCWASQAAWESLSLRWQPVVVSLPPQTSTTCCLPSAPCVLSSDPLPDLCCCAAPCPVQAGAATREAYGQDPTGRYMPHLSLLYADISTEER